MNELQNVDNLRLVVAGGGSPCQGLSLLNSQRQHFKDARSKLFFDMANCLEILQACCKDLRVRRVRRKCPDEQDRDNITERLGWKPYLANSADISWVRLALRSLAGNALV